MTADTKRKLREYGLTSGTLGSNGAQTLMVVLLPVLLQAHAPSAVWIGVVIGMEGAMAILVPFWIGWLSDRLPDRWAQRFGRRAFFLWLSMPFMVAALATVPFLESFWFMALAALAFFAALHVYMTPLWALLIDAVPDERRGRVQGVRGVFQALGLGFALIAGGLLLALWEPLPFLLGGLLIVVTTWLTVASIPEKGEEARVSQLESGDEDGSFKAFWQHLKERPSIFWFLAANALWDGGVDGIRPYIFIFATVVIGITMAEASLVLGFLLVGLGIGSVVIGRLGDRFGRARLLAIAAGATGVIMALGILIRDVPSAIVLLALAGICAAAFISLPFPVYAGLAGDEAAGRQTALYMTSLGFARLVAPIAVGAAIDWGTHFYPEYDGYPFMWPMAALLVFLSVPALLRAVKVSGHRLSEL